MRIANISSWNPKRRCAAQALRYALVPAITVGLIMPLLVPSPARSAKPPVGRTYFTVLVGLEERFDISQNCFEFTKTGVCTPDGQICGSWQRTESTGKKTGFSFELSLLDDGVPTAVAGEGRLDARGRRSSIGGAGRLAAGGPKANFSFAGREATTGQCLNLLEDDDTDVAGSGNVVTESRDVAGFNAVVFNVIAQLNIEQTGTESLEITAEENVLPHLTSEVRNGQLILGVEPGIRISTTEEIVYNLTVDDLVEITASGISSIDVTGIDTDLLRVNASGFSTVVAEGTVDRQRVRVSGTASYLARRLESREATVNVSGFGIARVRVSELLQGSVEGFGRIEYFGDPVVDVDVAGFGSIARVGD